MRSKLPLFHKASDQQLHFKKTKRSSGLSRRHFLPLVIGGLFFLIISRLFQLTIVKGSYYRHLAENNRVKEVPLPAPHGSLLDRKGFTLVYSENNPTESMKKVRRVYNEPYALAHIVGYRQSASQDEISHDLCPKEPLKPGDSVGKEGLEKIFECQLRGLKGKRLIEVDAHGRYLKTLSLLPPKKGKTIQTSLDLELQKKAYAALTSSPAKGGLIVSLPATGEVLALVSTPSFSPQNFEDNHQTEIKNYLNDPDQPLFNRPAKGVYPPGSIFKLVVAAGSLEEGVINEKTIFEDTGQITAGTQKFGNWYFLQYGKTEGFLDVVGALRRSNDIFFYQTGEKLGEEKIKHWAAEFGLGKKTGGPLAEEDGLIPSRFWKKETLQEGWFLGDTYNFSIGQGYLLTTPLQVNYATAVFANNGLLCRPQILKLSRGQAQCRRLPLSSKAINLVREGMRQACSPGGTGWPFFDFRMVVACKTGTAQSHAQSQLPHAWFTVFAPFDKPEIIVTVLVEESGEGSNIAGPIAKEILTAYFERNE